LAEKRRTEVIAWTLAVALAAGTGWLQIMFRDLHLALLAALAFAMLLGVIHPRRPWVWALLIGFAPALAEFYRIIRGQPIRRGAVEDAFAAVLPAFVGAYGGSIMNMIVKKLYEKPPEIEKREKQQAGR
jgi:hypothetical protein